MAMMSSLLHFAALLGAAALQKHDNHPDGIEERVNNIEETFAKLEQQEIEAAEKLIRAQKEDYQRRLVAQRDRIQAKQAENEAMFAKFAPTQESIEELHKNATGAFEDTIALTRALKLYEHNLSLARAFAEDSVNVSEKKVQEAEVGVLSEFKGHGGIAPHLSKLLIERPDNTSVEQVFARLSSDTGFDKPEFGSKLTDSFNHLMKETDEYYEDLANKQSNMKEKLDQLRSMKAKVGGAAKHLAAVKSNLEARANALRAFSDTLGGEAELPLPIQKFATHSMEEESQKS